MVRKKQARTHNEWFRPVERGKRKSCSYCKAKLEPGEWIWCCGAYITGKWRNQFDCCKQCWPEWAKRLVEHEQGCPEHCTVNLVPYHCTLPAWMTLPRKECSCDQGMAEKGPGQVAEMVLAADITPGGG